MKLHKRTKLLVLSSTYPRSTSDTEPGFVHQLCKHLLSDFDVTVICPHSPNSRPTENLEGVNVIRYRYAPRRLESLAYDGGIAANIKDNPFKLLLLPLFFLSQLWVTYRFIRLESPDAIHAHWIIPQGFTAALLKTLEKKTPKILLTSHGGDLFSLRSWPFTQMKRFSVRRAAAVTVVSRAMLNEAIHLGLKHTNINIQPMGVDLRYRFTPSERVERSTNEILFVGRLVEKKGLRYLIDAMPTVLKNYPDAFLTVIGAGPEMPSICRHIHRLNLTNNVNLVGPLDQGSLPLFFRRAALFVAPFIQTKFGDQEGLGLVVIEAIGCGCPSVVADVPATRDITDYCENIIVTRSQDSSALANAICNTLANIANNKSEALRARSMLLNRFDWTAVSKRYSNILQTIQYS